MLRRFTYLPLVIAAAVIAGCTDKRNAYEAEASLSFNPVINTLTKADSTSAYPTSESFGILGYRLPSGKTWAKNSSDATLVYDHSEVSYAGKYWQPADPDQVGAWQRLTVLSAYAPYDADVTCTKENGVEISGFNRTTDAEDIMFAGPVYDYNLGANNGIVQLPFTKVLTEIDFFAFSDLSSGQEMYLKSLTLEGFSDNGDFVQFPTPRWTVGSDNASLSVFEGSTKVLDTPEFTQQIGGATMVIPQTFNSRLTAVCDFTNSAGVLYKTETYVLEKTMTWSIGAKCVYVLKFDEQNEMTYSYISENL